MIEATKFTRRWPGATGPWLAECSDGVTRVIRCTHSTLSGSIANQWITDYLGFAIGAPVLPPEIVDVEPALIASAPELAGCLAGPAHAQEFLGDVVDVNLWPSDFAELSARGHRPAFASLAVLLGWFGAFFVRGLAGCTDPLQVQLAGDRLVSVDHHDMFTTTCHKRVNGVRSGQWCPVEIGLQSTRADVHPGFAPLRLERSELEPTIQRLERVTRSTIANAIASMPAEWMPVATHEPMIEWLNTRRRSLVSNFRTLPLAAVA